MAIPAAMDELAVIKRHYAEGLRLRSNLKSDALVDALATVARERFLGPPPWRVLGHGGLPHETSDARQLYHDQLVALIHERRLNNGQPSFLASLIDACKLQPGEHAVHLGAGVGYYTAIISEVVGKQGRVTAIEADEGLAARAIDNLADRPQVKALHGDALEHDFGSADAIFVNFGFTHPHRPWLERLREGGRLVMPFTGSAGTGVYFRLTRRGTRLEARLVSPTGIFASVTGRDPEREREIDERLAEGPAKAGAVASLRLDTHDADDSCWWHAPDFCLSKQPLEVDAALAPYTGTFKGKPPYEVTFSAADGALRVSSAMGSQALEARGEHRFEAPGVVSFVFQREGEAPAHAVTLTLGNRQVECQRV